MILSSYLDKHLPDLKGKTYIVTGANGGLGLLTSLNLAYKGAHVVMLCHDGNEEKRKKVTEYIYSLIKPEQTTILFYEQASFMSIDKVVEEIKKIKHIDGVSLNAGVYHPGKNKRTANNYSLTLGVNFLGTYYLLDKLIPILNKFDGVRVDITSSVYTKKVKPHQLENVFKNGMRNQGHEYATSKYLLMSFASTLFQGINLYNFSERKNIIFTCSHPGVTATNIIRGLPKIINKLGNWFMTIAFNSLEKSSLCPTVALAGSNVRNGQCYFPNGLFNVWGYPKKYYLKKRFTEGSAKLLYEVGKFFKREEVIVHSDTNY